MKSDRPLEFSGRGLLVASDADMVASAYADGQLDRVAGIEDTLSAIQLPIRSVRAALLEANRANLSTIQVSNAGFFPSQRLKPNQAIMQPSGTPLENTWR